MEEAPCTFVRGETRDGTMTIHTVGLAAAGQRELQMVEVPEMLAPVAERFLGELGYYATQKETIAADETIGVPTHFGANFARLVEAPEGEGDAGPMLRVVDVMEDAPTDAAPRLVLATELFEEAFRRYQRGEMQVAAQLLQTSIETFPGAAGVVDLGANVNNQNFRAYLLLHTLTQDPAHLQAALDRSASFQLEQLGAPLAILDRLLGEEDRVRAQVELVRQVRLATWDHMEEENPGAMDEPVAPIPQPHLHTNAEGKLDMALSLVPTSFADAFYRGVGRAAVEEDEAVDVTVEALAAHRGAIAELVGRVQEAATMWGATEMDRGPLPPPLDRSTGLEHLITSVLAQVGALAEMGLDAPARRAWLGLSEEGPSEADRQSVQATMKAREQELVQIIRAAQSPPS